MKRFYALVLVLGFSMSAFAGGDDPQVKSALVTNAPTIWTNTALPVKVGSVFVTYSPIISATCSVYVVNGTYTNLLASGGSSVLQTFYWTNDGTPVQVSKNDKIRIVTSTTNAAFSGSVVINNLLLD